MTDAATRHPDLLPWEVLDRCRLADGAPWVSFWVEELRLPDGRIVHDYYTVEQPDHVAVVAVTDKLEVLGVWHYKHGPRGVTLGVPGGYVQPGEKPLLAAAEGPQRELREETGYEAARWRPLGSFAVDGNRGGGWMHAFLAQGLRAAAPTPSDDLEEMRIEPVALASFHEHLRSGRITTMSAALAITLGLDALRAAHVPI